MTIRISVGTIVQASSSLVLSWKVAGSAPRDLRWLNTDQNSTPNTTTDGDTDQEDDHVQVVDLSADVRDSRADSVRLQRQGRLATTRSSLPWCAKADVSFALSL